MKENLRIGPALLAKAFTLLFLLSGSAISVKGQVSYLYGIGESPYKVFQIRIDPSDATKNAGVELSVATSLASGPDEPNAFAFDRNREQFFFLDRNRNLRFWDRVSPNFTQLATADQLNIENADLPADYLYTPANAAFFNNSYWFFKDKTNKLTRVTLNYSGTPEIPVSVASITEFVITSIDPANPIKPSENAFGDIAFKPGATAPQGTLYCHTIYGALYSIAINASNEPSTLTVIKNPDATAGKGLQLAFSFDFNTLYGHRAGASGRWYTINLTNGDTTALSNGSGGFFSSPTPTGLRDIAGAADDAVPPSIQIDTPATKQLVCANQTAVFKVTAGTVMGGTLTYEWFESTDGGTTYGSALTDRAGYSGSATNTLNVLATGKNNYRYKCVVTETLTPIVGTAFTTFTLNATGTPGTVDAGPAFAAGSAIEAKNVTTGSSFTAGTTMVGTPSLSWSTFASGGYTPSGSLTDNNTASALTLTKYTPTAADVTEGRVSLRLTCSITGCTDATDFKVMVLSSALPVTWGDFSVMKDPSGVKLKWSTLQEINSKDFLVQRSQQGLSWEDLGTVDAAGYSGKPLQYSYLDKNVTSGSFQYRLKQRDLDGKVSISETRSINVNAANNLVTIYGNPVTNGQLRFSLRENSTVTVVDAMGRTLYNASLNAGNHTIQTGNWARGNYTLRVNGSSTSTNGVVIQ